jgi:hypothetical protein
MPLVGPSSPFNEHLARYGLDQCLANETTLWIGADGSRDWPNALRLEANPAPRKRVVFMAAPVQAELVAAFVGSAEAGVVEDLFIGTSEWYIERFRTSTLPSFDMREAVGALRGARLPALRALTLGDQDERGGGLRMFGTVGEIGPVFAAAPALRYLGLHGQFSLAAPVAHTALETIEALFDQSGITGEPISQETFDALLSSSFDRLQVFSLALSEGGDDDTLTIPDRFLAPGHLPALTDLGLDRLTVEARERLDERMRERGLSSTA